jgi:hypothetical protein
MKRASEKRLPMIYEYRRTLIKESLLKIKITIKHKIGMID